MRLALPLMGVWLAACLGGEPPIGNANVAIGTGETGFEEVVDQQELEVIAGGQGGHHVWISLRAEGLSSNRALLEIDAIPLDATEPPPRRAPVRVFLEPIDDEMRELVGWPAILPTVCMAGRPVSIRVKLTDSIGQVCMDERVVVPFAPQEWLTDCGRDS